MDNQYGITLVCFSCGKKVKGVINKPMQFSFELAQIANEAEMLGVIDCGNSRSLVFCNNECLNNQKTKRGTIRLRPKKVSCA